MTLPLKATVTTDRVLTLTQMTLEELAFLRYNLRVHYATHLHEFGTGAIQMGDTSANGVEFGTATNIERTIVMASNIHAEPDIHIGNNDTPYSYRQIPGSAAPTTFSNSYASYELINDETLELRQERSIGNIVSSVIDPCIAEMKTGDRVGTYIVADTDFAPTDGVWTDKGEWFVDSMYQNPDVTTYNLYLKRSDASPTNMGILPLSVQDDGSLLRVSIAPMSPLFNFLLDVLKSRVSASLTYDIGAGEPRGNFIDTRFSMETITHPGPSSGDDYRTTATPSGDIAMTTYFLGLI